MPDPRPTADDNDHDHDHESEPIMPNTSAAYVLPATRPSRPWRWIALGLAAAVATWVVLVVLASTEASSLSNGTATTGILGLDMVTVTTTRSAEGSSAGLTTERGAAALLVLPLAGVAVALTRRRYGRDVAERD